MVGEPGNPYIVPSTVHVEISSEQGAQDCPPLDLAESAWQGVEAERVATERRDPEAWRITTRGPLLEMLHDMHVTRSRREAREKAAFIEQFLTPEEVEAIRMAKRVSGVLVDQRRHHMTVYRAELAKHSSGKKKP